MSGDASRARSVGPFVKIVASATWLAAIEGLRCSESSTSTCVCSASCFDELRELSLCVLANRRADLHVLSLHLKPHRMPPSVVVGTRFHPSARPCASNAQELDAAISAVARANVTTSTSRAPPALRERRARRGRRGRAGRVDVVDEHDALGAARRSRRTRRGCSAAARRSRGPSGAPSSLAGPAAPPARAPSAGASSAARPSAGCCPRRSWRTGSGGIGVMTSPAGRSTCAATSSAARTEARRSPCSFHARTSARAGPL